MYARRGGSVVKACPRSVPTVAIYPESNARGRRLPGHGHHRGLRAGAGRARHSCAMWAIPAPICTADGKLAQLTHGSLLWCRSWWTAARITAEEAEHHPQKNTHHQGSWAWSTGVEADCTSVKVQPGRSCCCSARDGLSNCGAARSIAGHAGRTRLFFIDPPDAPGADGRWTTAARTTSPPCWWA